MSGTFMDGGSGGGDGSGTFMDGGGDHGSHSSGGDGGLGGHDGGSQNYADGSALGNLLSNSAQNQHGFLAHLLGLDHDGGSASGMHADAGHVSQGAIWSSALQSVKFSDFTQGLRFTPAMGMACVYAGFIASLFVLYAIRHNEPTANAILGIAPASQGPSAYTSYTDRRVINRMRGSQSIRIAAFPDIGKPADKPEPAPSFFNFLPPAAHTESAESNNQSQSQAQSQETSIQQPEANNNAPFGSPLADDNHNISSAQPMGGPGMSIAAPASAPLDSYSLPTANPVSTMAAQAAPGNLAKYSISTVQSAHGRKLKFIVNN
jgi:hypothetical protein